MWRIIPLDHWVNRMSCLQPISFFQLDDWSITSFTCCFVSLVSDKLTTICLFLCVCLFAASPLMGAQSFPNLTTTGTTSTVTMSTSIVTSSNNVATATTGLSVGQLLSNTLTTSLTSTSSESDTGQEAEFSLYGWWPHSHSLTEPASANLCCLLSLI